MRLPPLSLLNPLGVAVAFGVLVWIGIVLTSGADRVSAISFSNGLLLGFLLVGSPGTWRLAIPASFIANCAANLFVGDGLAQAIGLAACNMFEVGMSLWLLRQTPTDPSEWSTSKVLRNYVAYAVLIPPALGALAGAAVLAIFGGYDFAGSFARRFAAHALGIAVVLPLVVAMRSRASVVRFHLRWADVMPYAVLIACALANFTQSRWPLLFLIFPPFLLAVFRHQYLGAAISIAIITSIAVSATILGVGPLMLLPATTPERILMLQLILVTCVATAYPICAMLTRQRALLASLAAKEQQLRVIADHSRDVIIHTDARGRRTYVSPAIESMLGYAPEEAIGGEGSSAIHRDDRVLFETEESRLRAGAEGTMASYRVRHRNGHFVWVEVSAKTVKDDDGRVTGWTSTTRDISERKRIEEMKEGIIATVSHELRTPLTAMTGAIGLALSGKFGAVPATTHRLLELARTNGDRLGRLVNDILDFEKLSSKKMQFDLQEVAVNKLLKDSVVANELYAQRLNVTYRLNSTLEAKLRVDPHRFHQVMSNLLSNAAKFSVQGDTVDIDATREGAECVVRIVDRGCGIPSSFQSRIFERFSQADPSDRRAHSGTGLGMAIAKDMIEGMGGRIRFESEQGRGTTFFVVFPIVRDGIARAA